MTLNFIDFNKYKETYKTKSIKFYEEKYYDSKYEKNRDIIVKHMKTLDINNKIIKDFEKQSKKCSASFMGKSWDNIDKLLNRLDTDFKNKNYDYVIGFCDVIINSTCATDNQKYRAKELKEKADNAKNHINTRNMD